jgi:DNA replication and repair protein RecF
VDGRGASDAQDGPGSRTPFLSGLRVRDVRTYVASDVALGPGVTVIFGPNGAGKTNLLEAAYLACTGRSFRQAGDQEIVHRGASAAHVTAEVTTARGTSSLTVGIEPGERRRLRVDGNPVESLLDHPARPRLSVFLPDRMVLVKGGPALRRSHVDQLVAVLRPSAAPVRRTYHEALRQRNALLASLRARGAGLDQATAELRPWDQAVARAAAALTTARAEVVATINPAVSARADQLGLAGELEIAYRPRSADDADQVAEALRERLAGDLERGFTHHGPHRDDLAVRRDGRLLHRFGSQGEQRLALLALLLGETDVIERSTGQRPILLLDDVMSELDVVRRSRLVDVIAARGQALVTVTEAEHVPGADDRSVGLISVVPGTAETVRVATGRPQAGD